MRRRTMMVVAAALVLCIAGSAPAGITVVCNGTACGGTGPRDYWYEITTTDECDQFAFHVATGDGDTDNYSDTAAAVLVGSNWDWLISGQDYLCNLFGVGGEPGSDIHAPMTAHGSVATPNGKCNRYIFWTLTAPLPAGTYGLGFNNDTDPMDVSWILDFSLYSDLYADWSKAVGAGKGPVHGPSPEPATLSLLAAGIGALMLRRRRR